MSVNIETYVERAKRLGLDPTEACIACGGNVQRVQLSSSKFCKKHLNWEHVVVIRCDECAYDVGLMCGESS